MNNHTDACTKLRNKTLSNIIQFVFFYQILNTGWSNTAAYTLVDGPAAITPINKSLQ